MKKYSPSIPETLKATKVSEFEGYYMKCYVKYIAIKANKNLEIVGNNILFFEYETEFSEVGIAKTDSWLEIRLGESLVRFELLTR